MPGFDARIRCQKSIGGIASGPAAVRLVTAVEAGLESKERKSQNGGDPKAPEVPSRRPRLGVIMNTYDAVAGRDREVDRRIARTAHALFLLDEERVVRDDAGCDGSTAPAVVERLKHEARTLWGAASATFRADHPPELDEAVDAMRDSLAAFVAACKEAERRRQLGQRVAPAHLNMTFGAFVRCYNRYTRTRRRLLVRG